MARKPPVECCKKKLPVAPEGGDTCLGTPTLSRGHLQDTEPIAKGADW